MTMKSHTTKPSLLRQPLAPSILTEIRREIKNYNEEGAWMRFRFCKGDREENDDLYPMLAPMARKRCEDNYQPSPYCNP